MTEYLPDGEPIFRACMDSVFLSVAVENYRAYRYSWTGSPKEEPAIAAFEDETGTSIYVSWNGGTEACRWRFFEHGGDTSFTSLLGEVDRTSFENVLRIKEKAHEVFAQAVDCKRVVLRSTRATSIEPKIKKKASAGTTTDPQLFIDQQIL